jgi:hypothetical protein
MRITGFVLADEDVSAPGPSVETGAGVPGYSGGAKLQRVNYSPKPAASPVISPSHS